MYQMVKTTPSENLCVELSAEALKDVSSIRSFLLHFSLLIGALVLTSPLLWDRSEAHGWQSFEKSDQRWFVSGRPRIPTSGSDPLGAGHLEGVPRCHTCRQIPQLHFMLNKIIVDLQNHSYAPFETEYHY